VNEDGHECRLETARLVLRDLREEDCSTMAGYFAEPESHANILRHQRDPVRTARVQKLLAAYNQRLAWFDREAHSLAVCLRDSGMIVGSVYLHYAEEGELKIGWHFGIAHAGQGHATEAAAALLRFAFHDLKVARVVGDCSAANAASRAVFRKLGMRSEANGMMATWLRGLRYRELQPVMRHVLDRDQFRRSSTDRAASACDNDADSTTGEA
jgi:RimJ/RimL family protein N-acetyltransferase